MKTVGVLALIGKEYSCSIGDSEKNIAKQNPHLSTDEVQQVYKLTRKHEDEEPTKED